MKDLFLEPAWTERNRLRARAIKMLEEARQMWVKGEINQFLERKKRELGRDLTPEEWDVELPGLSEHCKKTWTPAKAAAQEEYNRLTYGGIDCFQQSERIWTDALALYRGGLKYKFIFPAPSENDRLSWLSGSVHDGLKSDPKCVLETGEIFLPCCPGYEV
jgi:hypothetical protein